MRLTYSIHSLNIPFQVHLAPGRALDRSVNIVLVEGSELVLIDTGVAGSEKAIYDYIRSIGRDPTEISMIVLTHSHPDHVGAASTIKKEIGCIVLAHEAEKHWIEDVAVQKKDRPVPGFDDLVAGSVKVDQFIADGDGLELGGLKGRIVHTPGHSPGSISVVVPMEGALITGDAVPVQGDIPIYDDALAQMRTLERLLDLADMDMMISAWDTPKRGKEVRKNIEAGMEVVRKVHRSVLDSGAETVAPDLVKKVLIDIGLSPDQANPMMARTIMSHIKQRDEPGLR